MGRKGEKAGVHCWIGSAAFGSPFRDPVAAFRSYWTPHSHILSEKTRLTPLQASNILCVKVAVFLHAHIFKETLAYSIIPPYVNV